MLAQKAALAAVKESQRVRQEIEDTVLSFYCEAFGVDSIRKSDLGLLVFFFTRYGEPVLEWMRIASQSRVRQRDVMKYICGIRRRWCSERPEFAGDVQPRGGDV